MELNQQQLKAASYSGSARNLLVNAGAGCGKTRTIISRAAHLINAGVDASRILMVTFTNKAAREMKVRLKSEVGPVSSKIQAGTFHSFCLQVMGKIPKSFDVAGLNIIDTDDQVSLMTIIRRSTIKFMDKEQCREFPRPIELVKYYSYSRNTCQSPDKYLSANTELNHRIIELAGEIFNKYQAAKKSRGYMDFDDLLEVFASALERKPGLRKAVAGLFFEVLVDEMQDTNPLQFRILKSFSEEGTRLFCVGDPAQSIYRFRGAEFKHVYRFSQMFPQSQVLPLSVNYRSNQEILDLSNWLLGKSSFEYRCDLTSHRGKSSELPRLCDFDSPFQEAGWVSDQISLHHQSNGAYSDIMILVRTGFSAKPLEAEFLRRGIPYRFIGGTVLSKTAHVRDVMSLLRIVRNRQDDLAWMRFLKLWPRIGERTAEKIVNSFSAKSDVNPIDVFAARYGSDHKAVAAFRKASGNLNSPKLCVSCAVQGLTSVLEERYDKWSSRCQDLQLLVTVASKYDSLGEFVDAFTLEPMTGTDVLKLENDDAVTLITVHSAKGTEANICYVLDARLGVYPHCRSFGSIDSEEEERRVLYVAMTRAKNQLIITRSTASRGSFFMRNKPTEGEEYFLDSVPDGLVARETYGWESHTSPGLSALKDIY